MTKKFVPIVCRIVERHEIHGEPTLLEVVSEIETISLVDCRPNDFTIVYVNQDTFTLTKKS